MGAGIAGTQFRHVDIVVQSPTGRRDIAVWTFRSTVKRILQQAGVAVQRHDLVSQRLNQTVLSKPITVTRAIPVLVRTAHRHMRVWTTRYTVSQALKRASVTLGPMDSASPSRGRLSAGTVIEVTRRWLVTQHQTVSLPYRVRHIPDPSLDKGHSQVKTRGQKGTLVKTLEILMQNGKKIKTTVENTKVQKPPRTEVIEYGTHKVVSRGGQALQFSRRLSVLATAYWANPAWSSGYTASGLKAQYGVVAVDPSVIPLGTHLYIPGYGFAIAGDTGSAIVGDHIDLCYNSGQQAVDWGARQVQVFILK